ncbi:MAG: N,N-dimethylformamidase beta subunit family domain-containing protein [Ramlibacter sp.]
MKRLMAFVLAIGISCGAVAVENIVQIENKEPGTDSWKISNNSSDGDGVSYNGDIKGYASATSVNIGETIHFFVSSYLLGASQVPYTAEIYRMGYYGNKGGRLLITLNGNAPNQPMCAFVQMGTNTPNDGLVECPWTATSSLTIPTTWVSGVYLAKLKSDYAIGGSRKESYIIFTVRDDARTAEIVFQQAVNTYQAYNNYPSFALSSTNTGLPRASFSKSLYPGNSYDSSVNGAGKQARKVSFNRPYNEKTQGAGYFFFWEAHFISWMEEKGYDVKYVTNVDLATQLGRIGDSLGVRPKALLSVGHDEYWTQSMYANALTLRNTGTSLGFFGGNNAFWRARYVASTTQTAGSSANRILESHKEYALATSVPREDTATSFPNKTDFFNTKANPQDISVSNFQQMLLGVRYLGTNDDLPQPFVVSSPTHWAWQCANVSVGTTLANINGYEVDRAEGGFTQGTFYPDPAPENMVPGSFSLLGNSPYYGSVLGVDPAVTGSPGTDSAMATIYQHQSGAWVFSAGTIGWSFGLSRADSPNQLEIPNPRPFDDWYPIKRATQNILNQMVGKSLAPCDTPPPVAQCALTVNGAYNATVPFGSSFSLAGSWANMPPNAVAYWYGTKNDVADLNGEEAGTATFSIIYPYTTPSWQGTYVRHLQISGGGQTCQTNDVTVVLTPPSPASVSCSMSVSPSAVPSGGTYVFHVDVQNASGPVTGYWHGTGIGSAGEAEGRPVPGDLTFTSQAGWAGVYQRSMDIRDSGGNVVCTTNAVGITLQ